MMVNSMTREEIQIQQINQDIKIFENRMAGLSKSKINVQELRDYADPLPLEDEEEETDGEQEES